MAGYEERAFKSDQHATIAIRRALNDASGSLQKTAEILNVTIRTLSRYIKRLNLQNDVRTAKAKARDAGSKPTLLYPNLQRTMK